MKEMRKVNREAYKYLLKIPPRFWSKSRFNYNNKCVVLVFVQQSLAFLSRFTYRIDYKVLD